MESAEMPINRLMDKKCATFSIEYYSAIKKNEIMSFAGKMDGIEC
jgi:hypothetical protein